MALDAPYNDLWNLAYEEDPVLPVAPPAADDAAAKFARLTPHEQRRVMALYALLIGEDGDSETA